MLNHTTQGGRSDHRRILVLGAGPTGLGAVWRLHELGINGWRLLESSGHPGGLAASFVDVNGFTWDVGGHVQFSHYDYFDAAMDKFLGAEGWLRHERESSIWMRERFIPYPFQYNLHRLPPDDLDYCLQGLLEIALAPAEQPAVNFHQWMRDKFGGGITDIFMLPYNMKVWAFPADMMGAEWVGDRVAATNLDRVLHNLVYQKDDVSWGPNSTFRFPKCGGTGAIWSACAERLPKEKLSFDATITRIDLGRHEVVTADGGTFGYDHLISTIPLTELINLSGAKQFTAAVERGLLFSATNVIGLGLEAKPRSELREKCWMYFPENNAPFYRATVFSKYSPNNVPDISRHWSLMLEVSESPFHPVNHDTLLEEVIQGTINTRLIERREDIVSVWQYRAPFGYPTPSLHRDRALAEIIPFFEEHDIYSRGRFGLWKYEVSNQDHSFMQGVEVVERLINGRQEITAFDPNHANSKKHPWPFERWAEADCATPREASRHWRSTRASL